jgi:glycosyl transferase family 25
MKEFIFNETNAFCINLKESQNRWIKMENKFNELNIKVSRWNASNVNDIKDNFVDYLNNGQKACSQSHINIWKHVVDNNLEYALILEDDACFDKKWKEKLNQFCVLNQDGEWDAIFLNASEVIEPLNTWTCVKEQFLAAGYIISNKGCRLLLNNFKNLFFSSDWMTSRLQLYEHSYSFFPWLIIQEGKTTLIGSNVELDHIKVVTLLNKINYSLDNYI